MTVPDGLDPQRNHQRFPPLFAALAECLKDPRAGLVNVTEGDLRTSISVSQGRVTAVTHPDTTTSAIVDLLQRVGLIDARAAPRAERLARKRGMLLEDALVAAGLVSGVTLGNVREALCREVVLALLLRRDVEVTTVWSTRRGSRDSCLLPIPFLLKEAQRRATEAPAIRCTVPSADLVFVRSPRLAGSSEPERWEDLKLSVQERQVYFFVDGRRSVTDLTLATCQSEFDVSRALHSLAESGLVRRVAAGEKPSAVAAASASAIRRAASLVIAVAALVAFIGLGFWRFATRNPLAAGAPEPFRAIASEASDQRIAAAMRVYHLSTGRPAESFQDLLSEGLVLPQDLRAAATFQTADGFLLLDDGGPRAEPAAPSPEPRKEDDVPARE
jgi:hypothetical protein